VKIGKPDIRKSRSEKCRRKRRPESKEKRKKRGRTRRKKKKKRSVETRTGEIRIVGKGGDE
jgi:hypothetical protein